MRIGFDTSVLVAALVSAHPFHARAAVWLEAAATPGHDGIASWHAMAETYSVLTRLPLLPRLSTRQAEEVVLRLEQLLTLVPLTAEVYKDALRRAAETGVRSGGLFDVIHLLTAERAGADVLVTFNLSDFSRLASLGSLRVVVPPDPPSLTIGS